MFDDKRRLNSSHSHDAHPIATNRAKEKTRDTQSDLQTTFTGEQTLLGGAATAKGRGRISPAAPRHTEVRTHSAATILELAATNTGATAARQQRMGFDMDGRQITRMRQNINKREGKANETPGQTSDGGGEDRPEKGNIG